MIQEHTTWSFKIWKLLIFAVVDSGTGEYKEGANVSFAWSKVVLQVDTPLEKTFPLFCNFKSSPLAKCSVIATNLFIAASQLVAQTLKDVNLLLMDEWTLKVWLFFINKLSAIGRYQAAQLSVVQIFRKHCSLYIYIYIRFLNRIANLNTLNDNLSSSFTLLPFLTWGKHLVPSNSQPGKENTGTSVGPLEV